MQTLYCISVNTVSRDDNCGKGFRFNDGSQEVFSENIIFGQMESVPASVDVDNHLWIEMDKETVTVIREKLQYSMK